MAPIVAPFGLCGGFVYTEARKKLSELSKRLEHDPIITERGEPVMALLSFEAFESLMETVDILSDSAFAAKLRESVAEAERGETLSLAEVEARLGE